MPDTPQNTDFHCDNRAVLSHSDGMQKGRARSITSLEIILTRQGFDLAIRWMMYDRILLASILSNAINLEAIRSKLTFEGTISFNLKIDLS